MVQTMSIIDEIIVVNTIYKTAKCRGSTITLLLLASVFLISACDSLVTTDPVSTKSEQRDMKDFQGTWRSEESDAHEQFSIVFDNKGVAHLASLAWNDEKQVFDIEQIQFITAWYGKNKYLSILKINNVDFIGAYPLFQYNIQDDLLIICLPDNDKFAQAIEDKELSGTIKSGSYSSTSISITSGQDVLRQYLIINEDKQLFECDAESAPKRISTDIPDGAFGFEISENHDKETIKPNSLGFNGCEGTWKELKECAEKNRMNGSKNKDH